MLWEKETTYQVKWSYVKDTNSMNRQYNSSLFKSYRVENGKVFGVYKHNGGLTTSPLYYIGENNDDFLYFEDTKIESGIVGYRTFKMYKGVIYAIRHRRHRQVGDGIYSDL